MSSQNHMKSVLTGKIDLTAKIRKKISENRPIKRHAPKRPHRVEVDNTSSSFFTIIEVFTYDFPGLLFSITNALFKCRLDVWVARIATKVDQVVDVFYVRNFDGQKIDAPDEVLEIKSAIEKVLLIIDN